MIQNLKVLYCKQLLIQMEMWLVDGDIGRVRMGVGKEQNIKEKMKMNELYKMLDVYRKNVTDEIKPEILDEKQKELGVEFPEGMKEFFQHFGYDTEVMSSFYVFDRVDEIRIEHDALIFGEKHEGMGRLGITLKHLSSDYQAISWYDYSAKEWYSEGAIFPEAFFFNIACWQLINSMESMAKVRISESELENLLGDKLKLFTDEKKYNMGCDMLSIYGDDILGCYLVEDEELYLGSQKGDDVLENIDECLNLDLDWL